MADTLILYRDDADTTGIDISDYVDVAQGGINPGDGGAREPVFVGGAQGYGQRLSHVQTKNRVFECPLLLHAATQDALNGLAQRIDMCLGGDRPWISWQREGASDATWYRVRYGRLVGDNRYDQKLEAQTAKGRRHLVAHVDPYGVGARVHWATTFVDGFPVNAGPTGPQWAVTPSGLAASHSAATRNFASRFTEANPAIGQIPSIGGDGPRMLRIGIAATSASEYGVGDTGSYTNISQVYFGFTRHPYSPVLSAASSASDANWSGQYRLQNTSTFYGPTAHGTDPWSPGGGYFVSMKGTRAASGQIPMMSAPFAAAQARPTSQNWPQQPQLYRMFACIRTRQHTTGGSSVPGRVQFEYNYTRGPVATLVMRSPSQWVWYDVGEMTSDVGFRGLNITGVGFEQPTGFTGLASFNFEVAAIAGLPADLGFCRVNAGRAVAFDREIAILSDSDGPVIHAGEVLTYGQEFVTGYWDRSYSNRDGVDGDISGDLPVFGPQGTPAASPLWIVALACRGNPDGGIATNTHHGGERLLIRIAAYDRYTWAK